VVRRRPDAAPAGGDRGRSELPKTPVLGIAFSPYSGADGPHTMSIPAVRFDANAPVDTSSVTIGVVLEIPEPWGTFLQTSREGFGDLQARSIPTHVTLLPPTLIPADRVDAIVTHLVTVAVDLKPFDLRLEGTDTFRPISPVVFIRVSDGGDGCDTVQRAVRTGPLRRDLTFPFHPHITVAHHLDDDALDRAAKELAEFSASFEVDSFVLYEHGSDGIWRPRRRFAFGSGSA
jgi:2'-5' RNA ligase